MQDTIYYFTFVVTVALCIFSMFKLGSTDSSQNVNAKSVKIKLLLLLNLIGLLSDTLLFHSLAWLFGLMGFSFNWGHGEILIAVVLFNMLIAFILSLVGAILLPWKALKW